MSQQAQSPPTGPRGSPEKESRGIKLRVRDPRGSQPSLNQGFVLFLLYLLLLLVPWISSTGSGGILGPRCV